VSHFWRGFHACVWSYSVLALGQEQHCAVQKLLVLTGDQREQILAHRHIKLVSLARLVQDRRELQMKLQVCTACPSRSSCSSKQLTL